MRGFYEDLQRWTLGLLQRDKTSVHIAKDDALLGQLDATITQLNSVAEVCAQVSSPSRSQSLCLGMRMDIRTEMRVDARIDTRWARAKAPLESSRRGGQREVPARLYTWSRHAVGDADACRAGLGSLRSARMSRLLAVRQTAGLHRQATRAAP